MADEPSSELLGRLDRLERELGELRARLVALERLMGSSAEHPADRSVVREKVAYDWQG